MEVSKLDSETRLLLAKSATSTIANILLKRGFRNVYMLGLAPLSANQATMVGSAFTLRFIPSREDLDTMANYASSDNVHRRAVEECPAGHVLVIDAMGCTKAASAGDVMVERLFAKGAAGIVTDGGFRDTPAIESVGLPAYQRHAAPPATPIAMHPLELNRPIACAGVAVYPNDVLVGDKEGIVVIPVDHVIEVAQEAFEATQYEEYAVRKVREGKSIFGLFPATEESLADFHRESS